MNWHVNSALLRRYVDGDTDVAAAMSIESHLDGCGDCRGLLPGDGVWLEDSWQGVADRVIVSQRGTLERMLVRAGVSASLARLLLTTPALRRSWWLAMVAVLGFAVAAAHAASGDERAMLFFLVLAPVLPVIGVAGAYGPGIDPAHELTIAAPVSGVRLLLIRVVAVLCATVGVAMVAQLFLPTLTWTVVGWLLPALALTSGSLVLGSWVRPEWAAGLVTAVWLACAGVAVAGADAFLLFRAEAQVWFAAVLVVAGLVLIARRESFDVGLVR